jgi:hypothetical protein
MSFFRVPRITVLSPALLLLLSATALPALTVKAADESADKADATSEESSVRLHRGLRERGVSFGFGQKIPYNRFDVRTDTTMFQVIPSKGRFRNATQEILWEAPLVVFTKPHTDFLAGLNLMFRQHLTSNRNFAPYLELGAGVNLTDLDVREVGGRFQFSLQGGVGVRKAIGKDSDLTVGLRWYHLSNAGLDVPNTGLNNYLVTVGYSHLM